MAGKEVTAQVNVEKMQEDLGRMQADLNSVVAENRQLRARFLEERVTGLTAQIQLAEVLRQQAQEELDTLTGQR